MAVPKQRKTKSRRNQRRMHIYVESPSLTRCPKCNKPVRPHTACLNCGYYKGRKVIDVLSDLDKKERKKKEEEIEKGEKETKKGLSWKDMSKK